MNSHNTMKPTGGVPVRRSMDPPEPNEYLLKWILSRPNMRKAWKRVKTNAGAPGVDGLAVHEFPAQAHEGWPEIRLRLQTGEYYPWPVKRVEIPKPSGGTRPLGIPTVVDRLIQQAIAQVLMVIFEPGFSDHSYGFRPNRSAHDAVKRVQAYVKEGYRWAVDMDLERFFDTVDHDVLMHRVARKVHDKHVLKLIGKYLRAGVIANGQFEPTRKGVPQGGPLSPLLSNILLDDLDKELERRGHRFVRYADDFIILVKSQRAGERVMASVKRFIERKLKLKINEVKSKVARMDQTSFLGFTIVCGKIRWSDAAFAKFKRRIRQLTGRSWFVSMQYRMEQLALYLRGWMNYYGISQYYRIIPEIDQWLRRRIRMCYWKQWRYARTKVSNLLKLGTSKKHAILTAISRRGPWHLSRTLATQTGMTNQWLREQGLLSVKELWVNIHYPAKTG
jgi:RNA-directed DNA polymerase